jgi:hypothetical protein
MRMILLTAVLAAIASPAIAQNWDGQALVPSSIATNAGVPLTSSNGGSYSVGGTVAPVSSGCAGYNYEVGYYYSPPPCTSGQKPYFAPGAATATGNLPTGATAAGSQVGIAASGYYPDSSAPAGVSYFSGYIPLSAFATEQSLATLSTRLDNFIANQQAINANVSQVEARLGRGVAMATSLALEGPIDGKSNHLSIGVGTYGDSNAVSLNYAHRTGPVDVGVAVSYAGGDTLGKAQVGFSW